MVHVGDRKGRQTVHMVAAQMSTFYFTISERASKEKQKREAGLRKHKKTPLISLDIVVENTPSHNFRLRKQQYPKQEKRKPYAHQKIPCLSQAIPVTLLTDLL